MKWSNFYTFNFINAIIYVILLSPYCVCFFVYATPETPKEHESHSIKNEKKKPLVNLSADKATLFRKNDTTKSVYEGNAIMTQGETRLYGEKITVHTEKNKITRVTAIGKRASFEDHLSKGKGYMKVWGNYLDYKIFEQEVYAKHNAELRRNEDQMPSLNKNAHDQLTADNITYNIAKDTVMASGEKQSEKNNRVIMIIDPQKTIVTKKNDKKKPDVIKDSGSNTSGT